MNIKRTWVVASATLAMAGFTGAGIAMASDDVEVKDHRHAPAVRLTSDSVAKAADANSADSPGEPGCVAPAPPPVPAPAPPSVATDSGNSPAPAPGVADLGDSPAPAPARPNWDDSADSGASAD